MEAKHGLSEARHGLSEAKHGLSEARHGRSEAKRDQAFFHARYFLDMAVKYGTELDAPPQMLPSGWAGLLYLYNLR